MNNCLKLGFGIYTLTMVMVIGIPVYTCLDFTNFYCFLVGWGVAMQLSIYLKTTCRLGHEWELKREDTGVTYRLCKRCRYWNIYNPHKGIWI